MKIRKLIKQFKIKDQILWAMILVSITLCLLLGTVVYNISKTTIQNNYKNSHTYNLQVSSNIIDIQLRSIIELGRTVLTDKSFKGAMFSEKNRVGKYFASENSLTIDRILGDISSQEVLIDGIAVVNNKGNLLFYSKRNTLSGHYSHYYGKDNLLGEKWVQVAQEAQGGEVFYGYNVLVPETEGDTFSYVKKLINPSNSKPMGYLVVNISKKLLDYAFGTIKEGFQTNRYMIIDSNSIYPSVFFNGDESAKAGILDDYLNNNVKGKYLFSSYSNETTGWMAVNVIEKKELMHDSDNIKKVMLFALFIVVIISIYFSTIISNQIIKPLNTLEKTIDAVGEGERHIEDKFDDSEIGTIGNKFKEMVNNNLELRERLLSSQLNQREAELLLMQAQINPHFLYNTLDSLYFMAIIRQDDDIAKMVLALSNMFKLNLNNGEKFISVSDEMSRISNYMAIQNMRYHDRFDLILDTEEIKDCKIITFILQPFIENAMYHGLEAKMGKGYIKVEGKLKEDNIYFNIIDNGVGIADLAVLENGYGVKNVKERIKLFYGEEYGVTFASKPNIGTTVTIVIPARQKGGKANVQNGSN